MSRADLSWMRGSLIAHRGLHDPARGIPENSLGACEAAAHAGHAIEIDVRLSADGEAMVFHDADLDRLTQAQGPLAAWHAEDLAQLRLADTGEPVPRLGEVLELVAGRVPLLIELKRYGTPQPVGALEARVTDLVAAYRGAVAVQSFHPLSVLWFARHAAHIPRGFLSQDYRRLKDIPVPRPTRLALRTLLAALPARPQFIGYAVEDLATAPVRLARRMGLPVLAWTVRDAATAHAAARACDGLIFENFTPDARSLFTPSPQGTPGDP